MTRIFMNGFVPASSLPKAKCLHCNRNASVHKTDADVEICRNWRSGNDKFKANKFVGDKTPCIHCNRPTSVHKTLKALSDCEAWRIKLDANPKSRLFKVKAVKVKAVKVKAVKVKAVKSAVVEVIDLTLKPTFSDIDKGIGRSLSLNDEQLNELLDELMG